MVRSDKAFFILLTVLVAGVVFESLLCRGALESLEADFALDALSGGIRLQLTLRTALRFLSVPLTLLRSFGSVAATHC